MAPKAVKATLAEFTAHAAELKSLERDLQREVKRKQKQARRVSRSFSDADWSTLCCLMTLAVGAVHTASAYLTLRHGSGANRPSVLMKLETWWAKSSMTPHQLRERCVGDAPLAEGLKKAEDFLLESRLQDWMQHQNLTKGMAPSSHAVLQQKRRFSLTEDAAPARTVTKRKCKLQWLRRWRSRWGVRLATLAAREVVPAAEKQFEVHSCDSEAPLLQTTQA